MAKTKTKFAVRVITAKHDGPGVRATQLSFRFPDRLSAVAPTIWLVEQEAKKVGFDVMPLPPPAPEFRITGLSGAFTTYVTLEDAVAAVLLHDQPGFTFEVYPLDRRGRPRDRPVGG